MCAVAAERYIAESRREEGSEEAGEGAEEVRESAKEGAAQDVEDGTEEHEVSVQPVLIVFACNAVLRG